MDYKEAIKEAEIQIDMYESMILYNRDFEPKNDNSNYERKMDFLKTAISAMKELQSLSNQGISMERMKDIDFRKEIVEHINYDAYMSLQDELEQYKKLGALEEVREAVEKQKAKKPIAGADIIIGRDDDGNPIWETDYVCAECGTGIAPEYVCCPYCGKKIDWSEVEE